MKIFSTAIIALCALLFFGRCAPTPESPKIAALSESDFLNPPLEARPGALWTWMNGYVNKEQITNELEEMKAKGMRGGIIWDLGNLSDPDKIIPIGPAFMGKESVASIHHAMDEASRLGLELGLVASSSWNAGGAWITPADGSKVLLWSETQVTGPLAFSDTLPRPKNTNTYFSNAGVMAIPHHTDSTPFEVQSIVNIGNLMDKTGRLTWNVPAGKWKIIRYVNSNTGQLLECPSPNSKGLVIDHLSPEALDHHLNFMLTRLKEGRKDMGSLKYFFFDSYEVWEGIDWTENFVPDFVKAYGYDPIPYMPVLSGTVVGSREISARFTHDYRKAVSDFIIANHFKRGKELLNRNGIQLIGEAGHGGYARVDVLKALGSVDVPMGEFWNKQRFWVTKEAASAAHIYGKKLVPAESLTGWQHWKDGPLEYKRLIDVAFCAGLNQVTFHTFAHNPAEAGLPGFAYHAGEHFNVNTTWWNYSKPMLDYLSRCSYMLQQGQFVADVCFYYGDQAPNLVPSRRIDPSLKPEYDSINCLHCGKPRPIQVKPLGRGYDYDYVNEEVLLTRMKVQDGKIALPDGMNYKVLVLPENEAISLDVLKKIEELVYAGAVVVGRKPVRSNSLKGYPWCDEQVKALAEKVWGSCDGKKVKETRYGKGKVIWNLPLKEVLASLGTVADFTVDDVSNNDQHIDYIHRRTSDEDYYFIANSSDRSEHVSCFFRVGNNVAPRLWNPADGSILEIKEYERVEGGVKITLDLAPAGSLFIVFKKDARVIQDITSAASSKTEMKKFQPQGDTTIFPKPWTIRFSKNRGAPDSIVMKVLGSWTESYVDGVKYYSGTAIYSNHFTAVNSPDSHQSYFLDIDEIKEVAEVFINNSSAGILWKKPFRMDISRFIQPGENQIDIAVTNLWNNRIVGDYQAGVKRKYTRTNMKRGFNSATPLIPSGIIGKVRIVRALEERNVSN